MRRMNRKSYSYHGVNEGESEEAQKIRFQVELEFVQCLACPNYLLFLAQRNYFKDPAFINYIKYLQYWKEPDYSKYLKYPMCLYFLDLLQHESFRKEIVNGQCAKFIDDQMILQWQHYSRKRMKILETGTQQQQGAVTSASSAVSAGNNTPSHNTSSHNTPSHTTPSHNSPGFAQPNSNPCLGNSTPGNNSPAGGSVSSSHNPSVAPLNTAASSLVVSPAAPNSGGSNAAPSVMLGGSHIVSSASSGLVSGSPRVSSPANVSPAHVLNGHSTQKLQ